MNKILFVLLLSFTFNRMNAQILPREGAALCYRLIGFSFPAVAGTSNYRIEIASGYFTAEPDFKKEIFKRLKTVKNKIIGEVPAFGKQYTWRIVYNTGAKKETYSPLYHFRTGILPEVDTNSYRLRIIKPAKTYKEAYVFVDGMRALYDMNGAPVWFLPDIDLLSTEDIHVRDMKLSPQGTITMLTHKGVYEVSYSGEVLWKMPKNIRASPDSIEFFHHEFTRLSNGHYMGMGTEKLLSMRSVTGDSSFVLLPMDKPLPPNSRVRGATSFGTLVEYDKNNNVVWSWRSSDYFRKSDIYYRKTSMKMMDVHENAFYFDEKNKVIYVGFKNLDRIIKVKYPEGTVTEVYGQIYDKSMVNSEANTWSSLFCGQHSCRTASDGNLYVFNNNSCQHGGWPTVVVLQKAKNSEGAKKIWEYECNVDYTAAGIAKSQAYAVGGNAYELPDRSFLVTMGGATSNVFIVNRKKEILWSAICEKWDNTLRRWNYTLNFHSSMITSRKELERLIWNSEKM